MHHVIIELVETYTNKLAILVITSSIIIYSKIEIPYGLILRTMNEVGNYPLGRYFYIYRLKCCTILNFKIEALGL